MCGSCSCATAAHHLRQLVEPRGGRRVTEPSGRLQAETIGITIEGPGTFLDDESSPFEADIEWLADEGITAGCNPPDNDHFCPDEAVTRAQMASFLDRALDLPKADGDRFTDDDNSTHEAAIERLAAAGITGGCNAGRHPLLPRRSGDPRPDGGIPPPRRSTRLGPGPLADRSHRRCQQPEGDGGEHVPYGVSLEQAVGAAERGATPGQRPYQCPDTEDAIEVTMVRRSAGRTRARNSESATAIPANPACTRSPEAGAVATTGAAATTGVDPPRRRERCSPQVGAASTAT